MRHVSKSTARLLVGVLVTAAAILLGGATCPPGPGPGPSASTPHDKNYRFIVPRTAGAAPTIDGTTAPGGVPDAGWNGAAKFDLDLGSNIPASQMWAIADGTSVYLYFEIEAKTANASENLFNPEDALVFLLGPNPAGGDYRRIHVFPCMNACATTGTNQPVHQTSGPGGVPQQSVYYYTGTFAGAAYTWSSPTALPAGFEAKVATATGTCNASTCQGKWAVELRIPRAGFAIGESDFFGLYVDLAEVNPWTGDATQYTWPPNRIIGGAPGDIVSQIESGTPSPDKWGLATLSTTIGNGVYFSASDIRTNQTNPSQISLAPHAENRFYADVHNNLSQSGTLSDAQGVRATFEFTNFGLGTGWSNIPTGGPGVTGTINPNPTARASIPATGSKLFEIGPWVLSAAERTSYGASPHYCVRVTLDSNDPNTLFFRHEAQANMNFVTTNSPFPLVAYVGAGGGDLPRGRADREVVLSEYFYNTDPEQAWQSKIGLPGAGKQYAVRVKKGESLRLENSIEPPAIKIPRTVVRANAKEGKSIQVPVRAGDLVTVLARGAITLRTELGKQTQTGPVGRDFTGEKELFDPVYRGVLSRDQKTAVAPARAFILASKHSPQARMGALVGSWDDFRESSFVIGAAATLRVPGGAQTLSLAINDVRGASASRGGDGYEMEVIGTPAADHFSFANPAVSRDPSKDNAVLPVGANLPTWIMRGARDDGKVIVIHGKTFRALEPIGSFGAVVTKIGP